MPYRFPSAAFALLVFAAATAAASDRNQSELATAEALWTQRAEGADGSQARAEPVAAAIAAYERAIEADPDDLEARWKLLRAYHFQGDHVLRNRDDRLALYERTRLLADEARTLLVRRAGQPIDRSETQKLAKALRDEPWAVEIYLQSAIHWGLWGDNTGKMKAAREGVGGKLRDFAQTAIELDEHADAAGGHRFMGRLHTEAPKIPFVTGWVDRKTAVRSLERACQLAGQEPYNQLYLADAWLRFRKDRRSEAIERLETLIATPPRAGFAVEDAAAIRDAKEILTEARD
jgi:tetratricopeptide (TPR) repeat protein